MSNWKLPNFRLFFRLARLLGEHADFAELMEMELPSDDLKVRSNFLVPIRTNCYDLAHPVRPLQHRPGSCHRVSDDVRRRSGCGSLEPTLRTFRERSGAYPVCNESRRQDEEASGSGCPVPSQVSLFRFFERL